MSVRFLTSFSFFTCSIFKDDDATVNKKLHKVLAAGLNPILCIGETKDEYELGLNKLVRGPLDIAVFLACVV